jgi:hypothetical protein
MPRRGLWCARRDSNSQLSDFKSDSSAAWDTRAPLSVWAIKLVLAAGFEPCTVQFLKLPSPTSWTTRANMVLSERLELSSHGSRPCASTSCATTADLRKSFGADGEIRTLNLLGLSQAPLPVGLRRHECLVNPAGFEPATSISAESRSLPLSYGFKNVEEGVGVEPTGVVKLRRFSGPLGVPDAQPSLKFDRGDTSRTCMAQSVLSAGLEPAALPFMLRPFVDDFFGACGRIRTYIFTDSEPDLQSGAFATQPRMRNLL